MTLLPVKDINEFKRVKNQLKERFEAEKTGDQDLFKQQSKKFQPLITTEHKLQRQLKKGKMQL